jgi:hypothetical protein
MLLGLMVNGPRSLASFGALSGLPLDHSPQGDVSISASSRARSAEGIRSTPRDSKTEWMSAKSRTPTDGDSISPQRCTTARLEASGHLPPATSAIAKSGSALSCWRSLNSSGCPSPFRIPLHRRQKCRCVHRPPCLPIAREPCTEVSPESSLALLWGLSP